MKINSLKEKSGNPKDDEEKETDWALLWWLHESEQLKEKLSREDIDKINQYVRENPNSDMWEIEYDD